MQRRYRDYYSKDTTLRAEFTGELSLAGMTHNLLIGADAYDYELFTLLGRYRGAKGSYVININDPVYGVAVAGTPATLYANLEHQQATGVYLQDQIELTDRWRALVGVRVDTYDQEIHEQLKNVVSHADDTQVSPRIGVVFVVNPAMTIYSSYSEGFVPLH
jgi:iron complex outermembrane receptor protein